MRAQGKEPSERQSILLQLPPVNLQSRAKSLKRTTKSAPRMREKCYSKNRMVAVHKFPSDFFELPAFKKPLQKVNCQAVFKLLEMRKGQPEGSKENDEETWQTPTFQRKKPDVQTNKVTRGIFQSNLPCEFVYPQEVPKKQSFFKIRRIL